MGSKISKDNSIDIYVLCSKPFYLAGEMVYGQVHINCKKSCAYGSLLLRYKIKQQVRWVEHNHHQQGMHGGHEKTRSYYNKLVSYNSEGILFNFGGGVQEVQYTFPFALLLPASIPGSMDISALFGSCQIKHKLKAVLKPTGSGSDQTYSVKMNIKEPMRLPIGPANAQAISNPKCCGFCKDHGQIKVALKVSNNTLKFGDTVNVSGNIDCSKSNSTLSDLTVNFLGLVTMVSAGGRAKTEFLEKFQLSKLPFQVDSGSSKTFDIQIKVPSVNVTTTIGRCAAKYYSICLLGSCGCCAPCDSHIYVYVEADKPQYHPYQQLQPPKNWNPSKRNQVNVSLQPFIYQPMMALPCHNQQNNFMPQNMGNNQNQNFQQQMYSQNENNNYGNNQPSNQFGTNNQGNMSNQQFNSNNKYSVY